MQYSIQQQKIFDAVVLGTDNLLIQARAGSGKSFCLLEAMSMMTGTVALCAYNNKIAFELKEKVARKGLRGDVGTIHSFGFRAWRKAYPKIKLEGRGKNNAGVFKFDVIADKLEIPANLRGFVKAAMSLAKQRAIGIVCPTNDRDQWLRLIQDYSLEEKISADIMDKVSMDARDQLIRDGLRLACKALAESIRMSAEVIDFDDMIYMPLYAQIQIDEFDWVLVDEVQDLSEVRRQFVKRMMKPKGRIICVGDTFQSIYMFSGADCDSMQQMQVLTNAVEMPLTVTYRCPKAVVAEAKKIVSDYEAHPSAIEGIYREIDEAEFNQMVPSPEDYIICRNTKPLVDIAFSLIRRGIACYVEGKEIGVGLLNLVNRWKVRTLIQLEEKLENYRERETNKLMDQKKEMQADMLNDRIDTVIALIRGLPTGSTVEDLKNKVNEMFADQDGDKTSKVTLMTAHRSKGLEARRVFLYGRNRFMPSRYAKTEAQMAQESNLCYVSLTRAQEELIVVNVY